MQKGSVCEHLHLMVVAKWDFFSRRSSFPISSLLSPPSLVQLRSNNHSFEPCAQYHMEKAGYCVMSGRNNQGSSFGSDDDIIKQIRSTILNVRNGEMSDIINSLQCDQVCSQMKLSPALVIYLLRIFGDEWKSALSFFQWAGSHPSYAHSTDAYNIIVDILGKMKQIDRMWDLVNEMLVKGLVTRETVAKLMRRLAGAGRWRDAIMTFENLESLGLKKDTETMNLLLDTLCKEGKVEFAREVFSKHKINIPPDAHTFNIFVHGWCKIKRMDEAEWTILEMKGCGICPSVISYSTIIQAYCKQFNFSKVYELLHNMEDEGCPPNIVTYTSIMHALSKSQNVEEALKIVERMKSTGCKPDTAFYNCLINLLGRASRLFEAFNTYDIEMRNEGVHPNLTTYNTLISVYSHHGLEEKAVTILKEMEYNCCKPDLQSYTPILKLYLKRGETDDKLRALFEDISNKYNLCLDLATYTLLIHGLCRTGKLEWAFLLFEEMIHQEIPPRKRTYKLLLDEADQRGLYDMVDRIKDLLKRISYLG